MAPASQIQDRGPAARGAGGAPSGRLGATHRPDEGARRRLVVWSPELGAAPACSAAPPLLRRPRLAS
ncbi:MAG: hypothetical protein ACYCXN_10305, partial [Acidimicrobiales bacterium]